MSLSRLGLAQGTLILFDRRSNALPLPDRCSRERHRLHGRAILVERL